MAYAYPPKHGLYDPDYERDNCGVGFVADIRGRRSHQLVLDADQALRNMAHRGACGCEENSGDGAGILTALPHRFLQRVCKDDLKVDLPEPGRFSAGLLFLPTKREEREYCKAQVERIIEDEGQQLVGWRVVPVQPDRADVGVTARKGEPAIEMLFVAARGVEGEAFERKLYTIRKRASTLLRTDPRLEQAKMFYVCSLSTKVIIYKGMLTGEQLLPYFPDLTDESFQTHLAMVHSRFSTNTFPSWDRAQPLRFMSHNGEINTLRGNKNWMFARQGVVRSELFGKDIRKLFPVVEPDCSDSGTFDNVLEFLLMTGRTLQEAVMMMIPEAFENHEHMSPARRAFYEYHSCLMEPWDGPASIAFTDGKYIGAVLDRNGLRPSRYYLTHDDKVIMASEVGVLPVDPSNVKYKGRLEPGRMFLVDFEAGRLVPDEEVKEEFAQQRPYELWLESERLSLEHLTPRRDPAALDAATLIPRQQAFGFTTETLQFMLIPLVEQARDPVGSMGNDSALAVLSDRPRLLYDYFKQLFAQVTNPAIDSIREEIIMSLECYIGPEANLLETRPENARRLLVPHPILTNAELAAVAELDHRGWRSRVIDITWPRSEGRRGLLSALDRISADAEAAIEAGESLVVLSDRAASQDRVPVSALLATGAVHHHLVRKEKRTRIGIVVETGEAREVHHHCLLVGYGADAINPYLAFESLWQARREGRLQDETLTDDDVSRLYRKAVAKGMLKVMAKMGISTLRSYKGAQIFEAIGLAQEVVTRCFQGTASRIQGVDFEVLASELLRRHALGFPDRDEVRLPILPNDGQFHWRADGERHGWEPQAIADLQIAARTGRTEAYERFARRANQEAGCTLRGLLGFRPNAGGPIPIEEVEPAKDIVKRFCTGAMSFGSISEESHSSLAVAMNRLGGKSNTGEGGEDPDRYRPLPDGSMNPRRSAIKQVASGRFGVTINYLTNADELQIKIAQGAKPGEGGELPGRKVDANIARIRHSTRGVGLISPPPHHDIYSIEDLAQLIYDLKSANPSARVSVKLVSEVGVGTIASGVAKARADHILISGHDGGTGASPLTSIKHAGLPWELGIAETHQTLVMQDLRSRVVLQADGQMKTGRDVVIAAMLGAEEMGFSTAPLIALGCIMMRKCHLNTCPVGIATQDPDLRRKFRGQPEHVVNYLFMVAEEARQIMARLGFRKIDDMIGRVDCLSADPSSHWKARGLDLSPLLSPAKPPHEDAGVRCLIEQDHGLSKALDNELIALSQPALQRGERVRIRRPILNIHRTVGATLSHEIAKRYGEDLLPDDTIHVELEGSAGQSFGAWLARGVTLVLEGDANDYVGKGMSGGRLVIYPPRKSTFAAEDSIIIGNVALYGATSGLAFFRGRAAERFCVRNSGVHAVVEGIGDHGCEYMTGGRVVILGATGRNFGAGMSGGIAYVWDRAGDFETKVNHGMVDLDPMHEPDLAEVHSLVDLHHKYTGSTVAAAMLERWHEEKHRFVKVMPRDLKRVLQERAEHEEETDATVSVMQEARSHG